VFILQKRTSLSSSHEEAIMQAPQPNTQVTTDAKPIQVGTQPGEVDRLTEEISGTGAANSEADVERLATEGPETGEDLEAGGDDASIPLPVITRG
jgi:hypothetical protein